MDSILTLARTEGMLFKFGSGTGSNLSQIRSSRELLAGGGTASGPVSFMKGYDAFAGVIKSGGKTRRAAKMVILNADHPDIIEFINCKVEEEKKAWALIDAGYDGSFTGTAYSSVFFQNSNNSVRVTDEFMRAVLDDGDWQTHAVTSGDVVDTYKAREMMRLIAEGTWVCGDPGMQFDTTVNEWHTCPNTDRINASNPCSEYMFLDDSACNLASLNLMKFVADNGEFDVNAFKAACRTFITAQEILVDNSSYPTQAIEKNSHAYRPLGLGYANLGALLMSRGLPYDSDQGRDYSGAITALMTGEAYAQSARVARDHGGPFAGYEKNREPFLRVMRKHRDAMRGVNSKLVPADLYQAARIVVGRGGGARRAVRLPQRAGDRAGADRHHRLHDGLRHDRRRARHRAREVQEAGRRRVDEDRQHHRADGAQEARLQRRAGRRDRRLHRRARDHRGRAVPEGSAPGGVRLRVQGGQGPALDPLHGPHQDDGRDAAVHLGRDQQDGQRAEGRHRRRDHAGLPRELEARRQGDLDLPRRQQAHAAAEHVEGQDAAETAKAVAEAAVAAMPRPVRRKLPDERQSITHKFDIAGHEGYITVGLFDDGQPGEIFLVMAKEGSTISGFADAFAQAISYALQYGVPLQVLVDKFSHARFEPSGMTKNPEVRFAKSIVDYIFRWMATKFMSKQAQFDAGVNMAEPVEEPMLVRRPEDEATGRGAEGRVRRRGDPEPGRRAAVLDLRLDHDPQRQLLQVRQLRHDERLRVAPGWRDPDRNVGRNFSSAALAGGASRSRPFCFFAPTSATEVATDRN